MKKLNMMTMVVLILTTSVNADFKFKKPHIDLPKHKLPSLPKPKLPKQLQGLPKSPLHRTFECADGYSKSFDSRLTKAGLSSNLCSNSDFPSCCDCKLGQAICNKNHDGLKSGAWPSNCDTACEKSFGKKITADEHIAIIHRLTENIAQDPNMSWGEKQELSKEVYNV